MPAPTEHRHEKQDQHDPENHRTCASSFAGTALGFGSCGRFGHRLCFCWRAIKLGKQRIDPGIDPACDVALLEAWSNLIADNPA